MALNKPKVLTTAPSLLGVRPVMSHEGSEWRMPKRGSSGAGGGASCSCGHQKEKAIEKFETSFSLGFPTVSPEALPVLPRALGSAFPGRGTWRQRCCGWR